MIYKLTYRDINYEYYTGISNYWIFNLVDSNLEVYSKPYQVNQGKYNYLNKRIIFRTYAKKFCHAERNGVK